MGMPKIADYSYVQTSSSVHCDAAGRELEKLMSQAMAQGYVPQGGISYQCVLVNGAMLHILFQAIVRYDEDGRDYDHA